MFEHLDDPRPFVADESLRSAVVTAGGRRRRRRRQRLVGSGVVAIVAAVVLGGLAYVDRRDAAIDRVEVATQPSVDGAINILLLGDDGDLGGVTGSRVDAALLLRLDGSGARLLSIPRDLVDPVSGQRFSALAGEDLQASVTAVRAVLGDVPIDHAVRFGFDGFVALVDAVGGVPVLVDRSILDEPTGITLEPSERCQVLDGATALGLVRARHIAGDPTGDLGRMGRQRVLLQAALAATDAGDLDALSRVVADHATVDDDLTLGRMVELGQRLVRAGSIDVDVLPLEATRLTGGADVLQLTPNADAVLARYGAAGAVPGPVPGPTAAIAGPDPMDPGLRPC